MRTAITVDSQAKGLLELYKKDLTERLIAIGIEAIKPEIERSALAVVDSLNVSLQTQFDDQRGTLAGAVVLELYSKDADGKSTKVERTR